MRDRIGFWWRVLRQGIESLDSAARLVALTVLILGVAAGITVPLVFDVSSWLTAVVLMGLFIVITLEGSYRVWHELDQERQAAIAEKDAALAAQPLPPTPPKPLQPRYHHLPMGEQPWITEHCIEVFNPSEEATRRVRIYLVRMEPYPRHTTPGWPQPVIPYTVPLLSGGDPNVGVTIGPGQEELWITGYTATGSDGTMNAGGFSAPDYRWRGLPWQVDPDERWRLSYEIVSAGRSDTQFSIVVSPLNGHLQCVLEG